MRQLIKNEMRRAFINKKFLVVILIECIIVGLHLIYKVLPVYNKTLPYLYSIVDSGKVDYIPGAYYVWLGIKANPFRTVIFAIIPIIAAIPYGASLYTDMKSNYISNITVRYNRKAYYFSKMITLFISGGVIGIFPFVLSFMINATIFPLERLIPASAIFMGTLNVFADLFYAHTLLYVFIYIIVIFVGFGIINCFCFVAASLFENRFVVMMTPFTIYFAMYVIGNIIRENISPWLYLRLNDVRKDNVGAIMIQVGVAIVIIIVSYLIKSSRKADIL